MIRAPWEAEARVDVGLARRLIVSQFPALAEYDVREFGEGWDNVAYLVGERCVFRFPRRSIAAGLMETELRALPAIAPWVPLPVPVPRFTGTPCAEYAWPFAGYDLLAGETLTRCVLDDGAAEGVARAAGAFLRALHAIDPQDVPKLEVDPIGRLDHARCMPKALERLRELAAAGAIEGVEPFASILERSAPAAGAPERTTVVHGDLYGRHLLVDDDLRACGVIDWGDVHRGHPAVDLAVAFGTFPPCARDAFAAAYGDIDERTWTTARYRATYGSAMVAHYGLCIGDDELLRAGITGLSWCRV